MNFLIAGIGLAVVCLLGFLLHKLSQKKLQRLLQNAQQGDPQAQYEAALLYYHGKRGLQRNWQQAFTYLSAAAQTGHIKALNNLGALYRAGHGTEKDPDKAFACYQRSAEQGDFEGMINLAVLYRMQKNDAQAFGWIKKAADGNSPLGQRMLAEFYYAGIGTEPDKNAGLRYYMLAAKQGEPNAVQFLKTRDPRLQHHGPM